MSLNVQLSFKTEAKETSILQSWWSELKDRRADRAGLRRCKSTLEVVLQPGFVDLLRRIEEQKAAYIAGDWQVQRLALIAGVLSGIEQEATASAAYIMAMPRSGGDASRVSQLRFRRLLVIQDPEELLIAWKRMLRLMDNQANIPDLAHRLYWWNDRIRREMALEYYRNAPAAAA